jgi:hypothetical protein
LGVTNNTRPRTLPRSIRPYGKVLATSAAPSIFRNVNKINNRAFDGAKGKNNTIGVLVEEAKGVWGITGKYKLRAYLGCIVSIGMGIKSTDIYKNTDKCLAKTLKRMAIEKENTEELFSQNWDQGKKYYRFNLPTLAHVSFEEHKEKLQIESDTEKYLAHLSYKLKSSAVTH